MQENVESVLQKVKSKHEQSICEIIYIQNNLNLEILYENYPEYKAVIGTDGKDRRLEKNIFKKLEVIFTEHKNKEDDIKVIGIDKSKRLSKFVDKKYINFEHGNLEKFKVLVVCAAASEEFGSKLSDFVIAEPYEAYTRSYISFGAYDSIEQCYIIEKYLKTKFVRTMLYTLKISQMNNKDTWANVPLQDFTENSDIDWSKSVHEIDLQLYKKYDLSQEEIDFIETKVKEMT